MKWPVMPRSEFNGFVRDLNEQFEEFSDELVDVLRKRFCEHDEEIADLKAQVRQLKTELEAERRLRLGARRR
ncbi:hypothetical protein [Shimia sp.]|uniref:hypothetical protein n=1 Tax=Shimia sp. TaxID=1954381 RepID=UPI003BA867A5